MRVSIIFILFLIYSPLFAQNTWITADSIRQMYVEDRQMRLQVDSVYKKYGKDSPQWKSAWASLEQFDKQHNAVLKNILENLKVYPGNSLIGDDASHCFFTLVLHQDKDTVLQKKVIELMKPEVDKKNAEPNDYAFLIDRFKINTGKKQIYGTQCYYDPKKKAFMPRPIEDYKNVDKRRQEMELPPLSDYLKILNDSNRTKLH